MDEKLKEALMIEIEKRIASLENDKNGLETELSNVHLYENEKNGFTRDLEKVNNEIENTKNEKQEIEKLYEEKRKLQQEIEEKDKRIAQRRNSLEKDKKQLEEELSNEKDNSIKQELQQDLDKVNKELEVVFDEEKSVKNLNEKLTQLNEKADEYVVKYKIDKDKITSKQDAQKDDKNDKTEENKDYKEDKSNKKEENETDKKEQKEDIIIEDLNYQPKEQDFDEIKRTAIDGEHREINHNYVNQEEKFDIFQSIEIDANSKNVKLLFREEKNNKEMSIKEGLDAKKNLYRRINLKKEISEYCKQNYIGIFKKTKLKTGIDPLVIQAIDLYGGTDDLYSYFDSIAKNKSLPFDIHYNLTDSNLDKKSFNILNKYAKIGRNIEGITAEGIKENIIKRLIKGVKEGKVLKVFEKPKQIAEKGVKNVKKTKDNIADKAKTTKNNVANKTADKMVRMADRIRADGHADKVAKEYKEKQASEFDQNKETEKNVDKGREPIDD